MIVTCPLPIAEVINSFLFSQSVAGRASYCQKEAFPNPTSLGLWSHPPGPKNGLWTYQPSGDPGKCVMEIMTHSSLQVDPTVPKPQSPRVTLKFSNWVLILSCLSPMWIKSAVVLTAPGSPAPCQRLETRPISPSFPGLKLEDFFFFFSFPLVSFLCFLPSGSIFILATVASLPSRIHSVYNCQAPTMRRAGL